MLPKALPSYLASDKKKTGRARQSIHVCLLFNRAELQLPTKVEKIRVCLTDSPRDHAIMHYTVVPLRYFVLRLRFGSKYGVSEELFGPLNVK